MKKKLIIIPILAVLIVTIGARYTAATAETPAVPSRMAASPVFTAVLSWDTTRAEQDAETTPDALPDPVPTPDPEPDWTEFTATAHCACEKCCGAWALDRPDGIVYTASGAVAHEGVTIAADWDVLPAGTVVYIDGLGERIVQDCGEAIKGYAVDLYFADHDAALAFGRQNVRLYIADTGDTL